MPDRPNSQIHSLQKAVIGAAAANALFVTAPA